MYTWVKLYVIEPFLYENTQGAYKNQITQFTDSNYLIYKPQYAYIYILYYYCNTIS